MESMKKYQPILAEFSEAWERNKAVQGREGLTFRQMREIIEGEDFFPEQGRHCHPPPHTHTHHPLLLVTTTPAQHIPFTYSHINFTMFHDLSTT
jgi:hypothetical protein